MILVDTSVWIDHLRKGEETLSKLLEQSQVCLHPLIIGELACGNLSNRAQLLSLLQNLPAVKEASHQETLFLIESRKLMGKGIGFVDAHLLAASLLTDGVSLWTRDKRLAMLAEGLGVAFVVH